MLPKKEEGREMKFIHIADVHLGAEPEGLKLGSKSVDRKYGKVWSGLLRSVSGKRLIYC